MRLEALRQDAPVDVANWSPDAEFAVFPVGARAKEAFYAPNEVAGYLRPARRYLFKRSKKSYPDQFWGEVISYRIGCLLGVAVPPAFYAINSDTHVAAALIEWFYDPGELFMHGGDFLVDLRKDYEREVGAQHNLGDVEILSTALSRGYGLSPDWKQWWVDALLFDALIGNTDRHQDNWGFIFGLPVDGHGARPSRMAPLFDNGTSLGHERFPSRIAGWGRQDYDRYVSKGTHHVKWTLSDPVKGHFDLLRRTIDRWPHTVDLARARLNFHEDELSDCFVDLRQLPGPMPLTLERQNFIARLLRLRFNILTDLLR